MSKIATENPGESPDETDEEIRNRLRLLERMLDLVPDFFYVHNAELRFQYANRAAADYFERDKEDLVGRLHREVDADPEQAEFYERVLIPIIEKGEPVVTEDLPYKRRDGSAGLLQAHLVPFDSPVSGERMMLGISRDVTSERQVAEALAARAAYERELDIARRVQASLMPLAAPEITGFDVAGRCEPAEFVGGDFFDFMPGLDGRTIAVVGDVTGHGVGSALLAASCRSYARVLFAQEPFAVAMRKLDAMIGDDLKDGLFVTLAAVEMWGLAGGEGGGRCLYLSAGHGPVSFIGRDGGIRELPTQTLPLGLGGVMPKPELEPIELELSVGDTILIPSDGLFESRNESGEMFGAHRLAAAAVPVAQGGGAAADRLSVCFEQEARWRGDRACDDDRTAVVITC